MVKNPLANLGNTGDANLISGLGRSPGGGNDNPLQYYCPKNIFQGQSSLVGCSLWSHKQSDMTECAHTHAHTDPSCLLTNRIQ